MPARPDFNASVAALLKHVAAAMPEFAHIRSSRVLVVAGEARRASRGTVKPLAFSGGRLADDLGRRKPVIKVKGRRALYLVTLRPLFFRKSTPRQRVATILHELFHVSQKFDGTLATERRHDVMGQRFARRFGPLERKYWNLIPRELVAKFAYDGEVRVLQWLERPSAWFPSDEPGYRRVYTEKQLFEGSVRMVTKRARPELF